MVKADTKIHAALSKEYSNENPGVCLPGFLTVSVVERVYYSFVCTIINVVTPFSTMMVMLTDRPFFCQAEV